MTTGLQRNDLEALPRFRRAIPLSRPLILLDKVSQATHSDRRNSHQEEAFFRSEALNSRELLGSTSTPDLPHLPTPQTTHFPSSRPLSLPQQLLAPASDQVPSISISSHLKLQTVPASLSLLRVHLAHSAQHQQYNKTSLQLLHSCSVKPPGSHQALASPLVLLQPLLRPKIASSTLLLLQMLCKRAVYSAIRLPQHHLLNRIAFSVQLNHLLLRQAVSSATQIQHLRKTSLRPRHSSSVKPPPHRQVLASVSVLYLRLLLPQAISSDPLNHSSPRSLQTHSDHRSHNPLRLPTHLHT